MTYEGGRWASQLRRELGERNRIYARGLAHVESYGNPPVIVYSPESIPAHDSPTGTSSPRARHGNFFDPAYAAIVNNPEWLRRFDKIHAQCRALPKPESGRRWRELDSSTSSDALLMNVFCTPGVLDGGLTGLLGIDRGTQPIFGWKARVPLTNGRFDRTEVDLRLGSLLMEAKLTESDFQTRSAAIVEGYRDFDTVFDRDRLPRVEIRTVRRRTAIEFAEDYTQEWEQATGDGEAALAFQAELVARADFLAPKDPGYASYQLIRNVLAAQAENCRFCVIHDERRPDLREAWFQVMAAVQSADLRVRCQVLTWQELAAELPEALQDFLDIKYGIVKPGCTATEIDAPRE